MTRNLINPFKNDLFDPTQTRPDLPVLPCLSFLFFQIKILQYLEIIYKLWILDIVRGLLRALFI